MSAVLYGDWGRVRVWLNKIKFLSGAGDYSEDLLALGEVIVQRLRQHIQAQDLGWLPLSPYTEARKGFSDVYLETGEFIASLKAKVVRHGRLSMELMVSPEGKHLPSGLDMAVLAQYLEYGTSRVVARPLWRPVFQEVRSLAGYEFFAKIGARLVFK